MAGRRGPDHEHYGVAFVVMLAAAVLGVAVWALVIAELCCGAVYGGSP